MSIFTKTPKSRIQRNRFTLKPDLKFSGEMGRLIPNLTLEVLPGDGWSLQTSTLIRFAPMLAPIMHDVNVFQHYWFVPNRILFEDSHDWTDFISADLSKEVPPEWSHINIGADEGTHQVEIGSMLDYMGVPPNMSTPVGGTVNYPDEFLISAIPPSGFAKIYDEWYRDENLQDPIHEPLVAGLNPTPLWATSRDDLPRRAWRKDYFTSALPFEQKGPAVTLPLGDFAEVYLDGNFNDSTRWRNRDSGVFPAGDTPVELTANVIDPQWGNMHAQGLGSSMVYDPNGSLRADLTGASAATINDLRQAFALQHFFELAARAGTRYVEQLEMHFNVSPEDRRLQRPEFIGGTKTPVIISEVLQTSETADTPQANMSGHGISVSSPRKYRYYAKEHGYIHGILSIMPSKVYMQGIARSWSREDWTDYCFPSFAYLGEQGIRNQELYINNNDAQNKATFGYTPRYAEYRFESSRVAGEFRTTLNFWHMADVYANRPNLNDQFIECRPTKRIFAVQDEQDIWAHSFHNLSVKRCLPLFGVPKLIG